MGWTVDRVEKRRRNVKGGETGWQKRENNKEISDRNMDMMGRTPEECGEILHDHNIKLHCGC